MKKVLILTAGFGEGHNAAARNLRDALELVSDDVKVEVLDLFESCYGSFNTVAKTRIREWCNTRQNFGGAFIRSWTIPGSWKTVWEASAA